MPPNTNSGELEGQYCFIVHCGAKVVALNLASLAPMDLAVVLLEVLVAVKIMRK